jgi:FkbM family methyltransferase
MKGVVSVGANLGQEYEGWKSLGARNFIFFEPIKTTFNKLVRIMKYDPCAECYNYAVGNNVGFVDMWVETEHQGKSCSVLEPYKHLIQYPDIEFTGKEKVLMTTLDNFDFNRAFYDHLHIDTQGYEMEVLKGADKSMEYFYSIEIEVYKDELYKDCAMFEDVDKFLTERGFKLIDVFWRGMTWGDAKYQRT